MGALLGLVGPAHVVVVVGFLVTQVLYLIGMAAWCYLFSLPTNKVATDPGNLALSENPPHIILLYPVLRESEETMRTTFTALERIVYPKEKAAVVAIPNWDDEETIGALKRLHAEFPWLAMLEVPPTSDRRWDVVWRSWNQTDGAYWWHEGSHTLNRDLPPKKTRQLIYAFYTLCADIEEPILISYIDADSAPSTNYFLEAAAGIRDFDVVQLTNVAGNLLDTVASSFHASDHMLWDGTLYPHMTANGRHPYYVLGKGLFYKSTDLNFELNLRTHFKRPF